MFGSRSHAKHVRSIYHKIPMLLTAVVTLLISDGMASCSKLQHEPQDKYTNLSVQTDMNATWQQREEARESPRADSTAAFFERS